MTADTHHFCSTPSNSTVVPLGFRFRGIKLYAQQAFATDPQLDRLEDLEAVQLHCHSHCQDDPRVLDPRFHGRGILLFYVLDFVLEDPGASVFLSFSSATDFMQENADN